MASKTALPDELICKILRYVDPIDIIRFRLVSKRFREISYDTEIWRSFHTNAPFPRLPIPLSCSSASLFERTLVSSARLVKSWVTEPLQDVSSVQIQAGGLPRGSPKIIGGRWLISCELSKRFVLYDLESKTSPPTLLWEFHGAISSWDACSMMSGAGELVYVAFCEWYTGRQTPVRSWKLLEFRRLNLDSGDIYHTVSKNVPTLESGEFVRLTCHHGPFIYFIGQQVIFDSRTKTFYRFPTFSTMLMAQPLRPREPLSNVLFPGEYIIGLYPVSSPMPHTSTLVQAFVLPDDPKPIDGRIPCLRLTHETFFANELIQLTELRQSITDPATGLTRIRLLRVHYDGIAPLRHLSCLDFNLERPDHGPCSAVLPIIHSRSMIFRITNNVYTPAYDVYVASSDNGHARGFFMASRIFDTSDLVVAKFAIDASQDKCTAVCSKYTKGRWQNIEGIPDSELWFDGVRGKICFRTKRGGSSLDVTVVDVK